MKLPNHFVARASGLPLLAAIAASTLSAQQLFEIYPSRPDVSWTQTTMTRLGLGASAGEILMHIPGSHFRSVGNVGDGSCDCKLFRRFEVRFWDGDRSTPETFTPIIRTWTGTEPGDLINLLGIAHSTGVGPSGPGLVAMTMFSLAPYDSVSIPCADGFCIGVKVGPATYVGPVLTEGLAVLAAGYQTGGTVPPEGDYTRSDAASYAWSNPANAWVKHPNGAAGRTLAFAVDPHAPVLNVGSRTANLPNVSFGVGGMHPHDELPRLDGLDVRIKDATKPFGFAAVFLGTVPTGGIPLLSIRGCYEVIPQLTFSMPLDVNGAAWVNILQPSQSSTASFFGTIWVQSVVINASVTIFHFSNAQAVNFF